MSGAARTRGWRQRNAIEVEQRRRELLCLDRERKREQSGWTAKPVKVLVPWHVDEHGCRARTVGNEA